jgi:uncharacterized damage-inducible protein DinB
MTYYGSKEVAGSFRTVRENTVKIAEDIPDDKYEFRASPDTMTIGQTLTHIALSPTFQHHVHSNNVTDMKTLNFAELFQKFRAEEAKPRTKAELIALLKDEGEKFASYIESLSEAFLAEQVTMPPGAQPPAKSRFEMLLGAKEHEMHHRGQLMMMERMIGLVPHLTRQMQERAARMQASPQPQAQEASR